MISRRDDQGRIEREPVDHLPFADFIPKPRMRDGRSSHRRRSEPVFSVRMPQIVLDALKSVAETRQVSAANVILCALEPVLLPVLQGSAQLRDRTPEPRIFLGGNQKLSRLVPDSQKDSQNSVPFYDKVARVAQRRAGKPAPTLVDKGRR